MKNITKDYDNIADLVEEDPYDNNNQCGIYLYIDWDDKTVDVETHYRDGTIPFAVYHETATQIRLPNDLDATMIKSNIDDLIPKLVEIEKGYDTDWNGHNWIGTFTEESENLLNNLIYEIEEHPYKYFSSNDNIGLWDVDDYYNYSIAEITKDTTDEEIETLSKEYYDELVDQGVVIKGGVESLINLFHDRHKDLLYGDEYEEHYT